MCIRRSRELSSGLDSGYVPVSPFHRFWVPLRRGLVEVSTRPVDGTEVELRELLAARVGKQTFNLVAGLDRTDARGCAGQDKVALL